MDSPSVSCGPGSVGAISSKGGAGKKKPVKPKHTTTPAIEGDTTMAGDDHSIQMVNRQSVTDEVGVVPFDGFGYTKCLLYV